MLAYKLHGKLLFTFSLLWNVKCGNWVNLKMFFQQVKRQQNKNGTKVLCNRCCNHSIRQAATTKRNNFYTRIAVEAIHYHILIVYFIRYEYKNKTIVWTTKATCNFIFACIAWLFKQIHCIYWVRNKVK